MPSSVWRLRAAALNGAERAESLRHIQSSGQPQKLERYKVCVKCVEMDLIPRLDRAGVTLECKCAKEGGHGGSRMQELCAHCRISGTPLPSNICVLTESSLTEDLNEEQDYYLLPAGQTKLFLLIFGFLDYFCLFEIFALLFFSSQILSLSVTIQYV